MVENPSSTTAGGQSVKGHGGLLAAMALESQGIDTVFTLSGGHLFPLYDGCVKRDIRLIDVRHEQTAVFAAEGWAKVTRRPGVAALTAGPGVTNGVSALVSASMTGSPVLVIGGRAPTARWGQGSLQELDPVPIVESICKLSETVSRIDAIPETLTRALKAASTPHRGPTFVDLPLDVVFSTAEVSTGLGREPSSEVREADLEEIERLAARLAEARRPVFIAGADVYWEQAEKPLKVLAETLQVPIFMNGLGRGTLAADHPQAFSRARSVALKKADLVVVVGTPLDFRLGFGRFGDAAVAHVMDCPERLCEHVGLAARAAGPIGEVLEQVAEAAAPKIQQGQFKDWLEELRNEENKKRAAEKEQLAGSSEVAIRPPQIYEELKRRLARDAIVIGDGGDFVSYAGKLIDSYEPGCFLDPGPYGCLGTGFGYAMAARLAHPERQVVLLLGDGAAGFSLAELDTLSRFDLGIVIVVGNNLCWGLEKHPMQQLFGYHVAAELSATARYDQVAQALGVSAEQVSSVREVGPALDRAFEHGASYLLNVMTDPEDVYPRSSQLA